jgi:hypothetical protein
VQMGAAPKRREKKEPVTSLDPPALYLLKVSGFLGPLGPFFVL